MSDLTREAKVIRAMDAICKVARARMLASDPSIRGLHPAEADWFTDDEKCRMDQLHLELYECQPTISEIRERVAQRRAIRLKEQQS
jgi:hypothetical protein